MNGKEPTKCFQNIVNDLFKTHFYVLLVDKLEKLYTDEDSLRKEEIATISGPNEFAEFYGRLRTIKQYHRKYPNEISEPMQMEFLR